jgi:hypothetical protein
MVPPSKENETAAPPWAQESAQDALQLGAQERLQLAVQLSTAPLAFATMRATEPTVCDGAIVAGHAGA